MCVCVGCVDVGGVIVCVCGVCGVGGLCVRSNKKTNKLQRRIDYTKCWLTAKPVSV